jgi:hypothetical protein
MMYIRMIDNTVVDIRDGLNESSFPKDLAAQYKHFPVETEAEIGWEYDEKTETFTESRAILEETKQSAVARTKTWLGAELDKGMVWTDGKLYSIGTEKQGFLNAQLTIGILQVLGGANPQDVVLQWNESGKAHEPWDYVNLVRLAGDLHNYVENLVVKQQEAEEGIGAAESAEGISEILADFA